MVDTVPKYWPSTLRFVVTRPGDLTVPQMVHALFALISFSFALASSAAARQSAEPQLPIPFTSVHVFDGVSEERIENANVLVVGNKIAKVSKEPLAVANGRIIDSGGRTPTPGIINGHIMPPTAPLGNEVGIREGRCEAACKKRSASR